MKTGFKLAMALAAAAGVIYWMSRAVRCPLPGRRERE